MSKIIQAKAIKNNTEITKDKLYIVEEENGNVDHIEVLIKGGLQEFNIRLINSNLKDEKVKIDLQKFFILYFHMRGVSIIPLY